MAKIKSSKHSTRKDVIVEQAASLFREKGYTATSMRDLAEKVGVEAASLYNHISSKAEILQEICFTVATEFMSNIEQVELKPKNSLEKVEDILRFHIRMMINKYETVYVSDREWKHLNEPYLPNFQNQRRAYRQRFAAVIEEGIRNGEIKSIDAPTAVLIVLHAVSGIESWHRSKRKIPADQLEENMVLMLVGGLKK
ncbi:TetR/AcrR family transcriptional regulator [Gynurincola endophyticus]|jgi:AcrR family transcriptional regulator|uniref:TetR/AcrR family transcriptional regulator n=1 Tax=Gynurincola endophyticus TaxID=2479004 RepID=UPI000F8DD953|nr:TetR/AcrR family transcriptional regulator [Gynurincola endophyticus]